MKPAVMKIGEMVEQSGLTERMLRHYEDLGIIVPLRSEKGTRHYSSVDLEVARLIQHFREVDIPLDSIASIAKERRVHTTGDGSSQSIGAMLCELADHLADKAEKSLAMHRLVVDATRTVRECGGCTNRPGPETCPDCPMNEASKKNSVAAMIWQKGHS
ncbi:MAG: MerR family transcriptional regulator [Paracoccaceae bacterium]|nr:MerR family transcriptional regulator [Paracoccaceae bacterium]